MTDVQPTTPPAQNSKGIKIVLAIFLSMMAISLVVNYFVTRTYHYAVVQPGELYRLGNRGMGEFVNAIDKIHPRTVVSLIDERELADPNKPQFKSEMDYLAKNNIKSVRIPVTLGGWPTTEDLNTFLALFADRTTQPIFVHCAQGVRRTGMFVAAYQMSVLGYDKQKSKDAIQTFGHSDRTAVDIKTFIDQYDPATHRVATTLPVTSNE